MAGLMVVLGTRPEAIKLWPVIEALRAAGAAVSVCSTGQHRTLLRQTLNILGIKPDMDMRLVRRGPSLNDLMAAMLPRLSRLIESERPDRVIVQGDTTSALTAAIAAHHLRIPVAHVEAGLRSGDNGQPWPEEFNRKSISAIADLHFAPTERAAQALLAEGQAEEGVVVTGNTAIDALGAMQTRLRLNPALGRAVEPVLRRANGKRLVLVTCHRRENLDTGLGEIAAGLRALAARPDVLIVLPLHPNPLIGERLGQAFAGIANIALLRPLDHPCFVRLLEAAHLLLTDSGGVQEEAPTLGTPVLILRDRTERMEGVEAGTARLIGTRAQRIVAEACLLLDNPDVHARMARAHNPYGDGRAAQRIAATLSGVTSKAAAQA